MNVHVDRTPPTVAGREPSPGAADAWVRDPIAITFSEPVDLASALGKIAHPASAPALAVDARGDPIILWTEVEDPAAGMWNLRLARANR